MTDQLHRARHRFSVNVRLFRRKLGWSQGKLAEESGLHINYVGEVERGLRNISIDNMEKIADALGVPLIELLKEHDAD